MSIKSEDFQNNLNKKINRFFDIKNIYDRRDSFKESKNVEEIIKDYNHLNKFKINKTKKKNILNLRNFDKKKYLCNDNFFRKKILKINEFVNKKDIKKYFKFFLIHGSLATLDYVKGWSDVDTFVVIKDEILISKKKIIKLKKILKKMYRLFFSITKLQHHGLIIFTELDLKNYLNSYLPLEALEHNLNILNNKKIIFKKQSGHNKKIYLDLLERHNLLTKSNLIGKYMHHPRKNKYLSVPLKANVNEMYQLFCHLGYVNTLPAYYFSAIGKSCSKKNSFELFKKIKVSKKLKNFLKKSENVRKKWKENQKNVFSTPVWVINEIGKNFMKESEKNFNILINEIKKKNKY